MPAIRFRGVTKRYPGVTALSSVSFDVAAGSCHAVCGENGAGKSTLGRVLAGILAPDEGDIELRAERVVFRSPRDALAAGVAMVHQELAFCENLSVAENLCLGSLPARRGMVDRRRLHERSIELLSTVGSSIDPDRPMHSLSIGEQQLVQIAAAVGEGAGVIIFDEPTSSLAQAEAEVLYALIRSLQSRGVAVLYVSHRMAEIFALSDTITVLRDGEHVWTGPTDSTNEGELVQRMIGRRLEQYFPAHHAKSRGRERLRVEHLSSPGRFADVSFRVHAGEVVGLAGLVGAGRSELASAIFGLDRATTGSVFVDGRPVTFRSAADALACGMGFVPEDRKRQGLVLSMSAAENTTLPILGRYARRGWVDWRQEAAAVGETFTRLRVRTDRRERAPVASYSGGNQQKVVIARWLAAGSDILILDEPTRGVDVGTKAELHAWIDARASEGAAVLLISSELPELLNLSSRILVLRNGRVTGEVARDRATQDGLLRLMAGIA